MDYNPDQCPVCEGPMKDWKAVEMSAWQPIETAIAQSPQADDYVSVLLSDGKMIGIGWVMLRGNNEKRGMVSGHLGVRWSHWQPLPELPTAD